MRVRRMGSDELVRIAEIDRSEHVTREFVQRGRVLEERTLDLHVPGWAPDGDGEHTIPSHIAAWRPLLERGATLLGAFDGERVVGFAIYRPELQPAMANLAVLHVSRASRRQGVATRLVEEVARLARADGATRLYVSATPSDSAVGFYRSLGFEPTGEPDAELFALEPDDIHMIRVL